MTGKTATDKQSTDKREADRPPPIPGNHGQFGEDKATEEYQRLERRPDVGEAPNARTTGDGGRG
jgi:hypothetical protein